MFSHSIIPSQSFIAKYLRTTAAALEWLRAQSLPQEPSILQSNTIILESMCLIRRLLFSQSTHQINWQIFLQNLSIELFLQSYVNRLWVGRFHTSSTDYEGV